MFLDVQGRLFGLPRKSAVQLDGLDPADFLSRWQKSGGVSDALQNIDGVPRDELAEVVASLLRCPQRKRERHPTLSPLCPSLGFYKNIKPNLPNFFNDQLRPALQFADDSAFPNLVARLQRRLLVGSTSDDAIWLIAEALLPRPASEGEMCADNNVLALHTGPMLRDYAVTPSRPIPVCRSFQLAVENLLDLGISLPRVTWIQWLTASIRLWLPLFFLKRCAVTASAAQAVKLSLRSGYVPSAPELTVALLSPRTILRGSPDWFNQLAPLIQNYVRARFELSILLDLTNLHERLSLHGIDIGNPAHQERARQEHAAYEAGFPPPTGFLAAKLSMPNDIGQDRLPLEVWLKALLARKVSLDALARIIGANDTLDLIDKVYAQVRPEYEPLNSGFTKNLREFVAYNLGAPLKRDRDPTFPDEYNFIYRGESGRRARQVSIQPGPQLLGLLVQLVNRSARITYRATAKLGDLLDLFEDLGIDFRSNPEDFDHLKGELLRLGLMQSSADAAEAAALKPIYTLQ